VLFVERLCSVCNVLQCAEECSSVFALRGENKKCITTTRDGTERGRRAKQKTNERERDPCVIMCAYVNACMRVCAVCMRVELHVC